MHAVSLLLVHAAATLAMVGLIWFVQVVHYPLMAEVGVNGFAAYEQAHTVRTGWVVIGPMLVELVACVALLANRPDGVPAPAVWIGAIMLGVIWASTAFLQVPAHGALASGFDAEVHRRLVSTNWIRTVAWTARGALALWMVGRGAGA